MLHGVSGTKPASCRTRRNRSASPPASMNPLRSRRASCWAVTGRTINEISAATTIIRLARRKGVRCPSNNSEFTIARSMTDFANRPRFASHVSLAPLARWPTALAVACLSLCGARLAAQQVAVLPIVSLGTEAEERVRLSQLLTPACTDGFLMRSASRLVTPCDSISPQGYGMAGPELRFINNSGLPFSLNDGALWAGRGLNNELTAGGFWFNGRVRAIVAPSLVLEQNQAFQVIPSPQDVA